MRKRYKQKKRSCSLCKPHKTGHDKKLNDKQLDKLKQDEKEMRDYK